MTDSSGKFRPPAPLKINDDFKLAEWQKWLKSYRWYAGAVNLCKKSPDEQLSTLKVIMGPDALEIWSHFSVSETLDVESVLKKFEEHFTPKLNVPLERLNFNRLIQHPWQCFDEFLSAAVRQVDKCNFGDMRDDFLRDKIVAGIDDDDLRTSLLGEADLTFHKAVQMCRASAKQHFMSVLDVGNDNKVDEVDSKKSVHLKTENYEMGVIKAVRPDRRRRSKKSTDEDYNKKPFACTIPVCTFRTNLQKSLDRHMKIHKGEKRHCCNVCGYRSAVRSNVKDHMKTHSGEKPFQCHHCGFRCALKGYIRNHLKIHISDKPFACNLCEYKSNRLESLNRHKLRHTGEKPFACEVCDFRCSQKCSMKIHMRGHTGEKPYACDECEYRSTVPEKLRIHKMRCHTGEKPYACDFCDIGFPDQGSLRHHRRTHTGEKPFSCDVCGYKCALKGNLRKHMMRHTGEKPYACHVCEYRSAQLSSLKTHLMIHSGDKPNVCEICGHKCAHKGNLKKHMLTHTGERPYACSVCPYRSAQSSGLKTHMKIHTGEKPYVCDVCAFRCAHKGNLKQHMKTHKITEFTNLVPGGQEPWSETFPQMAQPVRHGVFGHAVMECNANGSTVSNSQVIPSAHLMANALSSNHNMPEAHSSSSLSMPTNSLPLSDQHSANTHMLHAGNPSYIQDNHQVSMLHRDMSVTNSAHHSPYHHTYAQCQNSHGQPT